MKNVFHLLVFLCAIYNLTHAQTPFIKHQIIEKTRIDVRTNPVTLASLSLNTPVAGKVILRFDGNCIASVGDRIVLAASDDTNWHVNDGSVGVEASNSDVNQNSFSHSRVYQVAAGNHNFYAIAHNYVETSGNGEASIYGTLTAEFFPNTNQPTPIVLSKNINQTRIEVRSTPKVLAQQTFYVPAHGKVVVRFDGNCYATLGDRIVLAASNTPNWNVNDGNVAVEATNSDVNHKPFSHTRVYDVAAGWHSFYAVAHNYVERDGNGEASIYGTLTVEFIPNASTPDIITRHQTISKTFLEVRTNPVALAQQSLYISKKGKVVVRFNGNCISTPGDRIVLAASNDENWHVNSGNVNTEAITDDLNSNSFSHTRVYEVAPGTHHFYAIAHNYVEHDGNGKASIYGTLTVQYYADGACDIQLPNPVIMFAGTEQYEVNGQGYTRYEIPVTNYLAFPDYLFEAAPDLPACGLNNNAARTWVSIYDQNDNYIYGFCALGENEDLKHIWFAVRRGTCPPNVIYVTLTDRRCGKVYRSNPIALNCASNNSTQANQGAKSHTNTDFQVYPNPSSRYDNTTVAFSISTPSRVYLQVFDLNGKLLYNLVASDELETGAYNYSLTGANLAAGTYLIRGYIGNETITKKLVVIE